MVLRVVPAAVARQVALAVQAAVVHPVAETIVTRLPNVSRSTATKLLTVKTAKAITAFVCARAAVKTCLVETSNVTRSPESQGSL